MWQPRKRKLTTTRNCCTTTTLAWGEKQPYSDWNFDKALKEINEAVALAPEGLYLQLQGDIYFAMKKYPEAVTSYEAVNKTNMAFCFQLLLRSQGQGTGKS